LAQSDLEQHSYPRLSLFLIVAISAAAAFLCSFALLRLGVEAMWVRYAVSLTLAYAVFLGCLWVWMRVREYADAAGNILDPSAGDSSALCVARSPFEGGGGKFGGGGASGSFDSATRQLSRTPNFGKASTRSDSPGIADIADVGEAAPLVLVVLAVVGVVALLVASSSVVWLISGAPAFLAELLVDLAIARGLYKRMHGAYPRSWFKTAIEHTLKPFVGLSLLCIAFAAAAQWSYPEVQSIGQLVPKLIGAF
jgi:uncharacterized membrane protein YgcG